MTVMAEEQFNGPNNSEHAYLDIENDGTTYHYYFGLTGPGAEKLPGIDYDYASNTLVMNNANYPFARIEMSEMGSDFEIAVFGNNTISSINSFADKYCGSITISGNGTLTLGNADGGIMIEGNNSPSTLTIDKATKVISSGSISVMYSTIENSINASFDYDSIGMEAWSDEYDDPIIQRVQLVTDDFVYPIEPGIAVKYDKELEEYVKYDIYTDRYWESKIEDYQEVTIAKQQMDEMGNPVIAEDATTNDGIDVFTLSDYDYYTYTLTDTNEDIYFAILESDGFTGYQQFEFMQLEGTQNVGRRTHDNVEVIEIDEPNTQKSVHIKNYNKQLYGCSLETIVSVPGKPAVNDPAHTHTFINTYLPASCFAEGVKTTVCNTCGYVLSTEPIEKTSYHANCQIVQLGKAPTCTEAGQPAVVICLDCGKTVSSSESIPALGHSFESSAVTVAPTSKDNGVRTFYCSNCNETMTRAIPKLPDEPAPAPQTPAVAKPNATSISKVTAKSKGFTVSWKKVSNVKGYEVQYSTDKNFKKGNKTVKITKNSTLSKSVTKLKGKKTYYVRVRTYKVVNGKTYTSSWSSKKAVTTKK